jgi:hypothetical protein
MKRRDVVDQAGESDNVSTSSDTPGAPSYRGKSSGEFQSVGHVLRADTNTLVQEAEGWIAKLTDDDNYRRLLQLAVLRRDAALLYGLLEVVRHRR